MESGRQRQQAQKASRSHNQFGQWRLEGHEEGGQCWRAHTEDYCLTDGMGADKEDIGRAESSLLAPWHASGLEWLRAANVGNMEDSMGC